MKDRKLKEAFFSLLEKQAVKAATKSANTTCDFLNYQPPLPDAVKKLRKL